MTALAAALKDRDTRTALEADFREYYGLSLKDIYRVGGQICWVEAARLMSQLPKESRLYNRVTEGETLTFQEHLLMSILDAERVGAYFAMAGARAAFGKDRRGWGQVVKNVPKPIKRPGVPEPEKKTITVPARYAKAAVSRMIQSKIARRMMGG